MSLCVCVLVACVFSCFFGCLRLIRDLEYNFKMGAYVLVMSDPYTLWSCLAQLQHYTGFQSCKALCLAPSKGDQ